MQNLKISLVIFNSAFVRETYRKYGKKYSVLVAFLDISKAFDSAWWPSIFDTLKHSECPPRLLSAIHNFFANRQVLLNFAGVAVSKWLTLGCPQGSILSPLLWNIFFNSVFDLPRHRFITTIAYADDLTIIAPHFNASLSTMILKGALSTLSSSNTNNRIKCYQDQKLLKFFNSDSAKVFLNH